MRVRSRLRRHQNRTAAQQAFIYTVLSIIFIVIVLKFGVPGFIQLVSWWSGKDAVKQSTDLSLPPQAPVLGDIPEATFSSQINVSGLAQAGVKVRLTVNGQNVDEMGTDNEGVFMFERVSLQAGENQLSLVAINDKNLESSATAVTVMVSKDAPKIEVFSPEDGAQISGMTNQNMTLSGKVDQKDAEVRINGNFVSVNSDGSFEYRTRLNEGENTFQVTAMSKAGNSSEKSIKVSFSL